MTILLRGQTPTLDIDLPQQYTEHVMRRALPTRIFRLSLAISVSLWMAGAACLLGCSSVVEAAPEKTKAGSSTVVAGDSCAAKHSHDCCASKQEPSISQPSNRSGSQIKARPRMMQNCPLAVSGSAVIGKARTDGSDEAPVHQAMLVITHYSKRLTNSRSSPSLLFNRGPTYLQCCAFLI